MAVYVEEDWEGGFRTSTYYVTKTGGTYIDDADFVDTPRATEQPYPEESYTEQPHDLPQRLSGAIPGRIPEQYAGRLQQRSRR